MSHHEAQVQGLWVFWSGACMWGPPWKVNETACMKPRLQHRVEAAGARELGVQSWIGPRWQAFVLPEGAQRPAGSIIIFSKESLLDARCGAGAWLGQDRQ